ncbi:hypothetical protein [Nocardioides sp.]|uniref:hypothetical protein n=1 Tax=Nocardioides sp. TaxID=35761 RepID=UPI002D7F0F3B|nr:hypothetical protein [Nocardioides sp.]HET8961685.1 hypothetical protein [Nocardioides sp.]
MHFRHTGSIRLLVSGLIATAGVLALPGSAGLATVGSVAEEASDYQTASLRFIETAPGRASGYRVRIDYTNPDDPDAKPPSVRRVVELFARGTRIDTGVPARCRATDAELMLAGRSACPRGSIVGNGFIKLDTGIPGPGRYLKEDVTFLNNTNQLIYLTNDRATGARTVIRARVRSDRVISGAPLLPGAGTDGTAIDVVRGNFPKLVRMRHGHRRAYVTTPQRCPGRGFWVSKVRFAYHDGTTQTESTRNRCDR